MSQYIKVVLLGAASLSISLLICAIVFVYIRMSLRRRSAPGLFWRFDRDRHPVPFWLQLAIVSAIIVYELYEMFYVAAALIHLS